MRNLLIIVAIIVLVSNLVVNVIIIRNAITGECKCKDKETVEPAQPAEQPA